jgi:hypothetical protein
MYKKPEYFDMKAALAFPRESSPAAFLAVMLILQDMIADASRLVSNMATSKDPGLLAHAAGNLSAHMELWDIIESTRTEAARL